MLVGPVSAREESADLAWVPVELANPAFALIEPGWTAQRLRIFIEMHPQYAATFTIGTSTAGTGMPQIQEPGMRLPGARAQHGTRPPGIRLAPG